MLAWGIQASIFLVVGDSCGSIGTYYFGFIDLLSLIRLGAYYWCKQSFSLV